jgi:hypothetical protein
MQIIEFLIHGKPFQLAIHAGKFNRLAPTRQLFLADDGLSCLASNGTALSLAIRVRSVCTRVGAVSPNSARTASASAFTVSSTCIVIVAIVFSCMVTIRLLSDYISKKSGIWRVCAASGYVLCAAT